MLFIISLLISLIFLLIFRKPLKKHSFIFYIIAAALTAVVSVCDFKGLPREVNTYLVGLVTRGTLATAFWCVVMWTGALPNGSKLMKELMPVRGELSIFAAFLTFGHVIALGGRYIIRFFTEAGKLNNDIFTSTLISIIMVLVMVPLTILSFRKVRKKIKASTWKKIQRTAYIFYALIYVHVLTFFVPKARMGREGYLLSIMAYSAVFIPYAVFRIRKAYISSCSRNKKEFGSKSLNSVCALGCAALLCVPYLASQPASAKEEDIKVPGDTYNAATSVTVVSEVSVSETDHTTSVPETSVPVTSVSETSVSSVTEISGTETEAVSESVTSEEEKKDHPEEEKKEEEKPSEPSEEPKQEEPQPEPEPEPEVQYVYNNGTYTASAYGYDGDVTVTITIENDVITSISGSTAESDASYFNDAKDFVFGQITGGTNTQVNAYSGCTYSSNGIMSAVANALNQARR